MPVSHCRRSDFRLPEGEHYVNCAYFSPLSVRVEDAGIKALVQRRNPASIPTSDFFEPVTEVRKAFAAIVGANDYLKVAVLPSVSYGMAVVAKNIEPRSGQNIVLVENQFPSGVYVWRRLAQSHGLRVIHVARPTNSRSTGQDWTDRIVDTIDSETALVCVPNVHWTDGTRFHLPAISDAARRTDSFFVIDGSQSVGALPVDVEVLQPDALICAGYKWLFGPYGMALAYFGERFRDGIPLEETWIARRGSERFDRLVDYEDGYQPGATRYDVGERSSFNLIPMMLEGLRQITEWEPSRIQEYCAALSNEPISTIRNLGFGVVDDASRCGHLWGIRITEAVSAHTVKNRLSERRVHVSVRGDAIRVSPNVYNDSADLSALVDALRASLR